jgi:hypothetical protein
MTNPSGQPESDSQPLLRLSAKATRSDRLDGQSLLTEAEIEAAEEEAQAWARRVNSC